MKEKWTPGSWHVGAMNDALFVINRAPSLSGSDVPIDTPHPGLKIIVKVESDGGYEKDSANAHLIAAAPDLYTALSALPLEAFDKDMADCDAADFVDHAGEFFVAMVKARAAMKKARGEA